ncbi:Hypothetical predicted protein [Mytilus galloprovincialis]|uniref:Ig-like domain-containing protein n=1 Tax=Mytilus galloprovincialis TaxID=29158 RepID=A0A8B6EHQ4_MYTGA|nr:Hypothetical predicted protein [Mytilus galloprovincialis]
MVPQSKTGAIGKNLTIPCNISEVYSGTAITWIKNNGSFDTIINIDNSDRFVGGIYNLPDLTIMSVQKEDEGNYTCQAQTLEFNGSSQAVHLNPVVNVSNIEPSIEGTNITISCYVSPTSEVTKITWYKNNIILDIYGNNRFSGGTISSPSLEIYFVNEYDEGNYTCNAMNPVGTNESIPIHLTILADIPTVLTLKEEAVNIGDNVTLSCNISSVSKLTKVVWSKNNIEVNLNANRTEDDARFSGGTLQDHSLTIYSVQIMDEGNYSCNASNAAKQTGWSNQVHLTIFEESLLSTDLTFSTSELSTLSSDIASTDLIYSTSELTDPLTDTMPSTKQSTMSPSVKSTIETTLTHVSSTDLTDPFSDTMPSTKPSTVSASVKSTIETSPNVPLTKSPNNSSTVNTSTTTSSTLSSTSKSTTLPSSSKPPNTVTYTVRSTTKTFSMPSSHKPTHTIGSKPPTIIPYSSSTVKTSTTTSTTMSSTTKSTTILSSSVGSKVSSENSENLNGWVITTTVICVVEFIVIVLVVYIIWLRKQRRLAMQYEKEETAF